MYELYVTSWHPSVAPVIPVVIVVVKNTVDKENELATDIETIRLKTHLNDRKNHFFTPSAKENKQKFRLFNNFLLISHRFIVRCQCNTEITRQRLPEILHLIIYIHWGKRQRAWSEHSPIHTGGFCKFALADSETVFEDRAVGRRRSAAGCVTCETYGLNREESGRWQKVNS